MSKRDRQLKVIVRRWTDRFGGPPTLMTDPVLMLRILNGPDLEPRRGDAASRYAQAQL